MIQNKKSQSDRAFYLLQRLRRERVVTIGDYHEYHAWRNLAGKHGLRFIQDGETRRVTFA